jgi:Domain of unknown function (DUF1735)
MKKILIPVVVLLSVAITSCLKDTTIKDGLDKVGTVAMVQYSGLSNFSSAAVVAAGAVDPIVNTFVTNLANADGKPNASDVTVKFVIDDAKRIAYNALPSPALDYELLPDSCFSFVTRTAIIKAGTNIVSLKITFFPDKINPSKLYMLPITFFYIVLSCNWKPFSR